MMRPLIFPLFIIALLLSVPGSSQKGNPGLDSLARLDSVNWCMEKVKPLLERGMWEKDEEIMKEVRFYCWKAIGFDSAYHHAWNNIGVSYSAVGRDYEALPYFLQSVKLHENYAEGWLNIGITYELLSWKDSAWYCYRESIHVDSTYLPAYEQVCRIWAEQGQRDSLLRLWQLAARNLPGYERVWDWLAQLYYERGDTVASVEATERAAEIDQDYIPRLEQLAMYYLVHNNPAKHAYYTRMADAAKARDPRRRH